MAICEIREERRERLNKGGYRIEVKKGIGKS